MTIFKLTAQITTRDTFADRHHRRDFIRLRKKHGVVFLDFPETLRSITCFAYSMYFTIEISQDCNLMGKT